MNSLPFERCNAASGEDVDREVQGERAGMEQVQRPEIDGASGEIGTAGRLRNNGFAAGDEAGFSHAMLYHARLPGESRFVSGSGDLPYTLQDFVYNAVQVRFRSAMIYQAGAQAEVAT